MPPKPKLTRDRLKSAALALADREGLEALSMRRLAGEVGTGAMTIYNYVRDRDALDALIVEAVMEGVEWPAPTESWRHDLRAVARAMWQAMRGHPNVIPLVLTQRSLHEIALTPGEALTDALARSGRSGKELLFAFRTVFGFVLGLVQAQLAAPRTGTGKAETTASRIQRMPKAKFPHLVAIASIADGVDDEVQFDAGLDIIVAGLERAAGPDPR